MLTIRKASREDAGVLKTLIHEMATYEKLPVSFTAEALAADGFGDHPRFRALMAEWDGQAAGYALYFDYYSSFRGRGIYLEDIYVRPEFRGKRVGKALFAKLAAEAVQEKAFGIMFSVLHWNQPAIDFYRRLNATFLDEWKSVCLMGEALESLAQYTL